MIRREPNPIPSQTQPKPCPAYGGIPQVSHFDGWPFRKKRILKEQKNPNTQSANYSLFFSHSPNCPRKPLYFVCVLRIESLLMTEESERVNIQL